MNADHPITPRNGSAEFADLRRVTVFFGAALAVAGAVTTGYAAAFNGFKFGGAVMWALALFAAGAGLGFLFGIPKVLQRERPTTTPAASPAGGASGPAGGNASSGFAYHQRVNTNLEEISDWLTKIIVGVSLIQLKSVPEHLRQLSDLIGRGISVTEPDRGFGVSIVLFYGTTGFIYGYLATRLYIQGALARAERGIEQEGVLAERELRTQSGLVAQQVADALQRPTLAAEPEVPGTPAGEIDARLRALAGEYVNLHISDDTLRIRRRNELAAEMAAHVIKRGISRARLADEANEGLLLTLAAAVQAEPQPTDTELVLKAALRVSRLHVQYRFVLAFMRLLELGYVSAEQRNAISTVLGFYESRADESLRQAIAGLRRRLEAGA